MYGNSRKIKLIKEDDMVINIWIRLLVEILIGFVIFLSAYKIGIKVKKVKKDGWFKPKFFKNKR